MRTNETITPNGGPLGDLVRPSGYPATYDPNGCGFKRYRARWLRAIIGKPLPENCYVSIGAHSKFRRAGPR